ncbi:hypothetical protein LguiA_029754 [Lonicera macranthoides]
MSNNVNRRDCEDIPDRSSKRHRLDYFSWQSMYSSLTKLFSSSDQVDIKTDAFSRMQKLRLLQLKNVRLIGDYKLLPHKLKWLCWHGFSLKSIPDGFSLESLVCLDMQNSNLEIVWKRTKVLRSLKVINLSHSHLLRLTPDFSGLPNIETLILAYCTNLTKIHESIGKLEKLNFLDLLGCVNLVELPRSIDRLKSLEKLVLSGCSNLFRLGYSDNMISLGSLPKSLRFLSVEKCNITNGAFPTDFGYKYPLLEELLLSGNKFGTLPDSIKSLKMLKRLDLNDFKSRPSLPELPSSVNISGMHKTRRTKI